jgi:hypothetical protein
LHAFAHRNGDVSVEEDDVNVNLVDFQAHDQYGVVAWDSIITHPTVLSCILLDEARLRSKHGMIAREECNSQGEKMEPCIAVARLAFFTPLLLP